MEIQKKEKKTPWEKEWEELCRREQRFLARRREKKDAFLSRKLEEKVPQRLQERLDATFFRAFRMIFEKGTPVIEKTYKKKEMEKAYQVDVFAASVMEDRKSLRAFSRKAVTAGGKGLAVCTLEGIGLGIAGVGLPDIPIFTGMILRSLYQIALSYGFGYETAGERYFILLLIRGALSYGEDLEVIHRNAEEYMRTGRLPGHYDPDREIRRTSETLSSELLYMKFLQGIPVAGAVGGAYDAVYMKRILSYGRLMYQKRFLMKYRENMERVGDVVEDE